MAARTVVALLLVQSLPSCAFQPFAASFQSRFLRPCVAGSNPQGPHCWQERRSNPPKPSQRRSNPPKPCARPAASGLHATAGTGEGGDTVAERIKLLWELENAIQAKDFVMAQELQGSLRKALALDEDEYSLRYTEIYEEFKALYEGMLETYIESQGSSVRDFYGELREATERDPDGPEATMGLIMLATTDFDVFMQMMRDQRKQLDARSSHK